MTRILSEVAATVRFSCDVNSYYTSPTVQSSLILDPTHFLWTHIVSQCISKWSLLHGSAGGENTTDIPGRPAFETR